MLTKWRFRIEPHTAQRSLLARTFGCVRFVYNYFLRVRKDAYEQRGDSIWFSQTIRMLTVLKKQKATAFLTEVSSVPLQQALRNLDMAYTNFFAKRAKYPKFKRKTGKQSAKFMSNGFGLKGKTFTLAKMGAVKVRWSRQIPEGVKPSSVTVTLSASGRYYATFTLDLPDPAPLPTTGQDAGVDLGITTLATVATTAGGVERVANPKRVQVQAKRLARLQRSLCRRRRPKGQRQSNRYMRLKQRIAKLQERIADSRKDMLDKLTAKLVKGNDRIGIENLNVSGMLKNHKIARAISDAGFGMFRQMLEYKAKRAGRTVVVVPRFFPSSQLCSICEHRYSELKLGESRWTCQGCGANHNRDENAARNLLAQAAGHAVSARGGSGKTSGASAPNGTTR